MSSLNITFQGYVNHKSQQPTNDALILYTPKKHYTKSPIGCPKTFSSSTTMLRSKTLIFWELSRPPQKKTVKSIGFMDFMVKSSSIPSLARWKSDVRHPRRSQFSFPFAGFGASQPGRLGRPHCHYAQRCLHLYHSRSISMIIYVCIYIHICIYVCIMNVFMQTCIFWESRAATHGSDDKLFWIWRRPVFGRTHMHMYIQTVVYVYM